MFQKETLAARQTCRHCREKAQQLQLEPELRALLRDPSVPRQTRMGAFRAIVALCIDELAGPFAQRDHDAFGLPLTTAMIPLEDYFEMRAA